MSEAAFAEAQAAAEAEEADLTEQPELEAEGAEAEEGAEGAEAKTKDWEKIAHDREGAVAKERSRRKAETARARQLEERLERLEADKAKGGGDEDQLAAIIASLRDDDEDPMTDIAGIKKALRTFMDRQKADAEQSTAQTQQQRQVQKLVSTMAEYEEDFRADHADYDKAQQHYKKERTEELEELGFTGQALQNRLAQDLFGIVQTAIAAGKDPAEAVYRLAKKRGFGTGAGTAEAAEKLKRLQESQSGGQRPSGGRSTGAALSWGDVAKLSGAARDAAFAKLRDQEKRAG